MPYVTVGKGNSDDIEIYYKDWGNGHPVVFSHGWPLSADAWEDQMVFLTSQGYRCIAHDRRGHGRSSQPWNGNDMDTYADDLAKLVEALDLTNVIHVGHSTGGGEVARYIGRHGSKRVATAVLIGAVPPLMLKTEANPGGLPREVFEGIRANVLADRSQFFKDLTTPFYGAHRPGAKVSQGLRDSFWLQGMMAGFPAAYFCIKAFSETDFTVDLKKIDVPTLILHGDDDQIVPIGASALLASKLIKNAQLKVYKGGSHGICSIQKDEINADLSHSSGGRRSSVREEVFLKEGSVNGQGKQTKQEESMITLRKAHERGHAQHGWLDSYHTYSFADYYDPAHMGVSALRVINEDRVQPGKGFPPHSHRDMEILTYVLKGALAHKDSLGNGSVIHPGDVQRMSAGTGITHSEYNPSPNDLLHLLQIWLLPNRTRLSPSYEQRTFPEAATRGQLRLVASPDGRDGSVTIHQDAFVYATTLRPGDTVMHKLAPNCTGYLHVARGDLTLNTQTLHSGDGVTITDGEFLTFVTDNTAETLLFDLP